MGFEFKRLKEENLKMVLKWRTDPVVTQYMTSDIEYNLEKQHQWFQKISEDNTCQYWIIYYRNIPVGLIGVVDINLQHRSCSWAYYIGEAKFQSEIGGFVPLFLFNYIFEKLKLNKIITNVIVENQNVIKLHHFHGHREVGLFRQHYFKNNRYHDVLFFEMLAEDWKKLNDKFGHYLSDFE